MGVQTERSGHALFEKDASLVYEFATERSEILL